MGRFAWIRKICAGGGGIRIAMGLVQGHLDSYIGIGKKDADVDVDVDAWLQMTSSMRSCE